MPPIASLAAYLFAAMVSWYPLATHAFTGATIERTEARYHAIAEDLATIALDEGEAPLFAGETGRAQTALLALSIAGFESGGFAEDVDTMKRKGDGGKAICLMQLHAPWSDGVLDRATCFRGGMRALRASWDHCRLGTIADRLTAYTTGRCMRDEHHANLRANRALAWWKEHPFTAPKADELAAR